jgi:hypothetical protein
VVHTQKIIPCKKPKDEFKILKYCMPGAKSTNDLITLMQHYFNNLNMNTVTKYIPDNNSVACCNADGWYNKEGDGDQHHVHLNTRRPLFKKKSHVSNDSFISSKRLSTKEPEQLFQNVRRTVTDIFKLNILP